jgi:hypothetical protein
VTACGRRNGARSVVPTDDAEGRRADTHRQAVPRLTTEGPFRYSRNPSYLALAMIYAGIAVLRNSLWAILLLPLMVSVIQRGPFSCDPGCAWLSRSEIYEMNSRHFVE